jgi:predicted dehydrogenase
MLRLVQIGLGVWGRDWAASVTSHVPGIQPVAWVDRDAQVRQAAIRELRLNPDAVHPSLDAAMRWTEAAAALVVVPTQVHAAAAAEALERGLHVLVEKPFTETMAEARELVSLATARQRCLMVNQNYRWFTAPQLARRLLGEGAVGEPIAVYADFHRYYGPTYRYFALAQPLLSDMAIHHFDTLRFVLDDEPAQVSCLSWTEPELPFAGPPAAIVAIRMRRGTLVSYRASWISRGPETPFGAVWRIDGTRGRLDFQFRGAGPDRESLDHLEHYTMEGRVEVDGMTELQHKDRPGALAAFAAWVGSGSVPPGASTAEDNLMSLALVEAAVQSAAANGAWIDVGDVLRGTPG